MKSYWRLLAVFSVNITIFLFGIIALELVYGRWLKTKTFVPNILPRHGISHDLSLGGNSGVTTRVPDENGAILYSKAGDKNNGSGESRCNVLVLGGSTTEERI